MASSDTTQKKRNNYKLLIDPELKKGQKKLYRLNGKDVPGFPPVGHPRDPRTQKTILGLAGCSLDLPVPRFKFDKFWEGNPPERDVFVIGLNESVKSSLLKEVCDEVASVHSIRFHRHPKSKTFLGAATVSFQDAGSGRKAVKELDGKIVGGCYLRAELDDSGDQLKKYLEPVLKKCGLDKPRPRQHSRDGASEADEGNHRPRTDSVTENVSESEGDVAHTSTTSAASTPHTPTQPRKTSVSDIFAPPVLHYPYSSLSLLAMAPRTPSESSTSVQGTSGSPRVNTPCTPSSIDSGISLRPPSSILSPVDVGKSRKSFSSLSLSKPQPPLPPPEENAPPLPPSDIPPPPLPPLPPAPSDNVVGGANDCGIENISSDEDEVISKPPFPPVGNGKPVRSISSASPVSLSPASSPQVGKTGKAVNGGHHHVFDPALGLQTLLAAKALSSNTAKASSSNAAKSLSSNAALAPAVTSSLVTTSSSSSNKSKQDQLSKSSPYVGSTSPRPVSSAYELEFEEISGDESPVMVCFEPLKVETISDDDMKLSDEDMEMCSDDDNPQESVIEVHVKTTSQAPAIPTSAPMLPPHGHPVMPHPPFPPNSGPPPPPPMGFFPPPPPGAPFPPHHLHPPPPPPPDFISPPHPTHPPHMMLHPPHEPVRPHPFQDSPPFINDVPINRLPNGYIGRHPPSRSFNKSKMLRGFSSPKNKRETISQDVLYKAMEQLRLILLNDVHKKIVENSAYPVLDSHWEKRDKEKQSQKSEGSAPPSAATAAAAGGSDGVDSDKTGRTVEPYRRMLPGMKVSKEGEDEKREEGANRDSKTIKDREGGEGEEEERPSLPTPRKRLMNFKIPLVRGAGQRRDQQMSSVVTSRRKLFRGDDDTKEPSKPEPSSRAEHSFYSDISSSEDFSSASEGEEERDRESSAEEMEEEWDSEAESVSEKSSSEDEMEALHQIFGSSDSESDFEAFVAESKQKGPPKKTEELTSEDLPAQVKAKTNKTKGGRRGLKTVKESSIDEDEKAPTITTTVKARPLEEDKENRTKDKIEEKKLTSKPAIRRAQFKKRPIKNEDEILGSFLDSGLDKEDVLMMKLAFVKLRDSNDDMVEGMHWAYYPHIPPSAPPPKRRRSTVARDDVDDHMTGCARSEGYYKIAMRDKVKYLPHHRDGLKDNPQQKQKNKSSGRVNRANQRKLASLFSAGDVSSDLAKYNQLKARKKHLKFAKSTIHNWGLFAMENIAADEMVIEYVGQMVRQAVADEREKRYEAAGIGSSYLFRVDHDYIIDATHQGNLARFINHCCDPNCYAKVINFGTLKKIVIYSKRDIALGEEITYDYKFPIEDDKIPCLCGAPNCRGTLN